MINIVVLGSLYLKGHVNFQREIIHFLDKTFEPKYSLFSPKLYCNLSVRRNRTRELLCGSID